jgi:hypothetical protein
MRAETWGVYGTVLFGYSILLTTMSRPFFSQMIVETPVLAVLSKP